MGSVLIYLHFDINSRIPENCESDTLRNCNKALLMIGMTLLLLSLSIIVATSVCDCGKSGDKPLEVYFVCVLLLSIALTSLSVFMKSNAKKSNNCIVSGYSMDAVLAIGVLLLVVSLTQLSLSITSAYKRSKKGSNRQDIEMTNYRQRSNM
jgi:hypothetical protein